MSRISPVISARFFSPSLTHSFNIVRYYFYFISNFLFLSHFFSFFFLFTFFSFSLFLTLIAPSSCYGSGENIFKISLSFCKSSHFPWILSNSISQWQSVNFWWLIQFTITKQHGNPQTDRHTHTLIHTYKNNRKVFSCIIMHVLFIKNS